jgi:GT2 family glycosyltransferase
MSICAVVPVWNGRALLARLLDTLDAQTVRADEILVIDNGSTDGAAELARARGARVIAMGRNAGFAAAVNCGIRQSRAEWIAALNSDVELAPDYLEILTRTKGWFATGKILAGRKPPAGGAAAARIDGTFDLVCRGGCAWRAGSGRPDGPLFSAARTIASPPWTAALFRSGLFERVGYLEESFGSYLEDIDFGLRCAAEGVEGVYEPRAVAWHLGSAALGRWHPETVRLISRNQLLLLARHYPRGLLLRWGWPILVAHLLWGGVALRHGAGFPWLRGKWEGIRDWRAARRRGEDWKVLERLSASESAIYSFQASTGFDSYWRLYFLLTPGVTK